MEVLRIVLNGVLCSITLWTHTTCVVAAQYLSLFIWPLSKDVYYKFHAQIMRFWSQNLFQTMDYFAPGELIITFDKSCINNKDKHCKNGQESALNSTNNTTETNEEDEVYQEELEKLLTRNNQGQVTGISFPEKLIMIANHQIYADWIYIWFIAYLSKAHGAIKIMLKHSLSLLPIWGRGMKFFEFIFLKRRLEQDKDNILGMLNSAKSRNRPMWLVLFPEGTVISDNTRLKSKNYATKLGMDDFKFTLLPRITGLLMCKETLKDSVEWLYDLTIAYPGIKPGENPEDVMTMKRIFCEGNGPHEIHIHVQRYRLADLPSDTEGFSNWLLERWTEKDKRMIYFNEHGKLPEEHDIGIGEDERLFNGNTVKIPIKLQNPLKECYGYLLYLVFYIPLYYIASYTIRYIYHLIAQ
ncbi:acyltransferase-domain-containing protein [Mycotypha africana]|uniref:acyltransferase-domain-containing protein n=1 Tax=Mycotypha africana TaxID=64632 RepID=UPI0023015FA6|nr:acyltransferase-domain-containing protein [Mycotypha africana]KAI8981790.1 acyltransferase-domain-containing protein [Mycotypha africana]